MRFWARNFLFLKENALDKFNKGAFMKKFLLIPVLALSLLSLAACTEKNKDSNNRPSEDVEMEAGGAYRSDWDNDFELPEDYFD